MTHSEQARNDVAKALQAAWAKAEPKSLPTLYPASYVSTFLDLADAALAAMPTPSPVTSEVTAEKVLLEAAEALNRDAFGFKEGVWSASNPADAQSLDMLNKAVQWLRDRAASVPVAGEGEK